MNFYKRTGAHKIKHEIIIIIITFRKYCVFELDIISWRF